MCVCVCMRARACLLAWVHELISRKVSVISSFQMYVFCFISGLHQVEPWTENLETPYQCYHCVDGLLGSEPVNCCNKHAIGPYLGSQIPLSQNCMSYICTVPVRMKKRPVIHVSQFPVASWTCFIVAIKRSVYAGWWLWRWLFWL